MKYYLHNNNNIMRSVSILGAGQLLLTANHPHLAAYADIQRGKHQRIIVVGEHWPASLASLARHDLTEARLLDISRQVLLASAHLNQMNIVNTNLTRDNILLTASGQVKLFSYGLGRLTNYGAWVDFPVGDPRLTAPEILRQERNVDTSVVTSLTESQLGEAVSITTIPAEPVVPYASNVDSWSLGMLLASLTLDLAQLWPGAKVWQVVRKVVSLGECESGAGVLERVAREHGCVGRVATVPQPLLDLIHLCLAPAPERPSPEQLLTGSGLFPEVTPAHYQFVPSRFPTSALRCGSLAWPPPPPPDNKLELLSVRELYYLWELAGGDVKTELRRHGLMVTTPPVLSLPRFVLESECM